MFGIITIKRDGERWLVHQADGASKAWDAIMHARVTGSRGVTHEVADWPQVHHSRVTARVERLSSHPSSSNQE